MEIIHSDIVIVGAGGAGLRAAIAAAKANPHLHIALLSKVYPMRSHTVSAEGGAAGVINPDDTLEDHFNDTVAGGDWLSDQDVVEYFVENAPRELTQMEHWGCPWSRNPDGSVAARPFGGMKKERTWHAADKTGFHLLHTLFQTSLQFKSIHRFDEFFIVDLLVKDNYCVGVVCLELKTGKFYVVSGKAVILATGGAGCVFPFTTNAAIKTGDGLGMAYRAGVALSDMEFVQYHPTGLPGTGILITEGSRGEGGILVNKDGYRYLQDYNLGPAEPWPRKKAMELGPRDRLSQAFWHEQQKGRTAKGPYGGDVVYLDIRHLGEAKIMQKLPMVRELAKSYEGVDPVYELIPVRPVVHYMMGGIASDKTTGTSIDGLFVVGECACLSLNGANRLGSNSLTELIVFGKVAGLAAVNVVSKNMQQVSDTELLSKAQAVAKEVGRLWNNPDSEDTFFVIKKAMNDTMEEGVGIYRTEEGLKQTCDKLTDLKHRFQKISIKDKSRVFNTELLYALELRSMLEIAEAVAHSALHRKESRGAHQRLDYTERNDTEYLKHSLATYNGLSVPTIDYKPVVITKSQPAERVYGGKGNEQ